MAKWVQSPSPLPGNPPYLHPREPCRLIVLDATSGRRPHNRRGEWGIARTPTSRLVCTTLCVPKSRPECKSAASSSTSPTTRAAAWMWGGCAWTRKRVPESA
eukprot:scaffold231464_cov32-Tisochrysis_lutea.AAC.1